VTLFIRPLKGLSGDVREALDTDAMLLVDAAEETGQLRVTFTVASAGDNDLVGPSVAGKAIRLRRISPTLSDLDGASHPLLKLFLGPTATPANEVIRGYTLVGRFDRTGPVDGHLILNLSKAGSVSGTIFYDEL